MSDEELSTREVDEFFLRMFSRRKSQKFKLVPPDNDPVSQVITGLAGSILKFAQSTNNATLSESVRSDRVVVRMAPLGDIEALTVWLAPRHLIAVNQGLALFLYRLARAFTPHVIVRGPSDPPAPPESDAAGIIATLLDWMASPVRAPLVADWPSGPREQRTAENYARMAERFVLGHEVAHIMRGHLVADAATLQAERLTPLEMDLRPVDQEHEADAIGAMLAVDSASADGIDPRAAVTGVHFFFQALKLCETVGAIHTDEAHRPAEERLAICDYVIGQRYARVPELRRWAEETTELIVRLGSAALLERDRRRADVAARMDGILQTTAWPFGKTASLQTRRVFNDAQSMFSEAPSAIIEALDANLLDTESFERHMAAARSPDALEGDDRLRRHRIAHYIARNAPLPVKHALGVEFPTMRT